jgi:hypothetical protein
MPDKFIPDADSEFAQMARLFASHIAHDPKRFELSPDDAGAINQVAKEFRDALAVATRVGTRTKLTLMVKDEIRAKAERVIREYGNVIRANPRISHIHKEMIGVKERPARLRRRSCPQTAPILTFAGSTPPIGSVPGKHILRYRDGLGRGCQAKPEGAARIELFVDLVGPGEAVPEYPGQTRGRWPWYVRSFTKNPIELVHPMPSVPMLIVYWARWADATGEVGPWSKTLVTRAEGWSGNRPMICDPHSTGALQVDVADGEGRSLYLEFATPSNSALLPPRAGTGTVVGAIEPVPAKPLLLLVNAG